MWSETYDERLATWYRLRETLCLLDIETAVNSVNDWWFRAPILARYLHWDNPQAWPDPWTLLADNNYCELARALGMCYTLMIVDHPAMQDITLTRTTVGNLVLVNNGKYIMNWAPGQLLNIDSANITIQQQVVSDILRQKIG